MRPDQAIALADAFGLPVDGLMRCTIDIKPREIIATCVYQRLNAAQIDTATEVVRRFRLSAAPVETAAH